MASIAATVLQTYDAGRKDGVLDSKEFSKALKGTYLKNLNVPESDFAKHAGTDKKLSLAELKSLIAPKLDAKLKWAAGQLASTTTSFMKHVDYFATEGLYTTDKESAALKQSEAVKSALASYINWGGNPRIAAAIMWDNGMFRVFPAPNQPPGDLLKDVTGTLKAYIRLSKENTPKQQTPTTGGIKPSTRLQ